MSMKSEAKAAARDAESSVAFRRAARAGYAASGAVHLLIGAIVLVVAFGGDGETDQAGAFKAIAAAPLGFAALWVLALALFALAAWHAIEGFLARGGSGARGTASKWGQRVSEWGQALVFAALGAIAASVALGARPDGDESVSAMSRGVLAIPGGPWVLALVGIGIGIGGTAFVWMGVRRSFEKKVAVPAGGLGRTVTILGVVGFIAKGVALLIVGILLVVAAVKVDPGAAGGMDAAIQSLIALPYGPWLAGAVGAGLAAYGVFCFFRARFAKL